MVGANGFEPSTSWSRTRRASQAALRPDRQANFRVKLRTQISTALQLAAIRGCPVCPVFFEVVLALLAQVPWFACWSLEDVAKKNTAGELSLPDGIL
jgi:hypothetical protein